MGEQYVEATVVRCCGGIDDDVEDVLTLLELSVRELVAFRTVG